MRIVRFCFMLSILAGCILCACFSYLAHHNCISFAALERYNPGKATILLDHVDREWARFELDRRKAISIEQMPTQLIHAFLAAEDWHFYDHWGISLKGIARSFIANVYHGRIVQGASTITQQLVRLLFFGHQRTWTRKLKEQLVAVLMEMRFSKDQILEAYLNHVYFGCGIYGVEAAARRFWGKSVADVSVGEAAVLAAIVQSPGTYCPLLHPLAAQRRRDVVLYKMRKLAFIDDAMLQEAMSKPVEVILSSEKQYGQYAREAVRQFLEQQFGDSLYTNGYIVKTTIDVPMQEKAEHSFKEHVSFIRKTINDGIDGGLLSIAVHTGEIRALIGGFDFEVSRFNRALQAQRQLGSIFKPLIFAVAMQQGMTFADVMYDEPITIVDAYGKEWRPNNYDLTFSGPMTLACALSRSNNIIAIKTFMEVGREAVMTLAKKCHVPDPGHAFASLSLGCIDVTLAQAVGMFNIFANDGTYVEPHLVSWVKDSWGTKVYKYQTLCEPVLEPRVSGQVLKVLGLGLNRVRSALPQKWIDSEAASKTGTTNDWRTCWFVGSTPEITTGVYIGRDDNRSMGANVYPLHTAFPIWIGLHREITANKKRFSYDPSLREIIINERTGKRLQTKKDKQGIAIYM